eukprot:TRINITY_DN14718_c0_g1_i1.p1 TRINITY_DN14718_c0_g1~~TRINITY_DN14718_c0_g1_i1.p1  ORF type:complete len:221 (-),score=27.31 TRINITY_DN14718_c0_g1_i1:267-929(-)
MRMEVWHQIGAVASAVFLLLQFCEAYNPGDFVPMSRRGQYHNARTDWYEELGRHCPRFLLDKEVVVPVPKPIGYTNSDEYKLSFEFGREKFITSWLLVIGRQSTEVPMLDVTLKHTGGDLVGVTAKVVSMPAKYLDTHPQIRQEFWDVNVWPKHILVRYVWEDKSEVDVEAFFYVLFGWAFFMTLVTSLTILQTSKDKIARFVQDNIVDTQPQGPVPKVE